MFDLDMLGWNSFFQQQFNALPTPGLLPARVAVSSHPHYQLLTARGTLWAEVSGRMRYEATGPEAMPAVGDWVAVRQLDDASRGIIVSTLERRTCFSRRAAGRRLEMQVIAANIDTVFIVASLNQDFNPRRLERYLTTVWDSGARPVIVLSKADLCPSTQEYLQELESISLGLDVCVVSAREGVGLEGLRAFLAPGQTVALVGSSGVGKSTLVNWLLGQQVQAVKEVREDDDRGRHTTTHRELFVLPEGGLLIDTPGMRELQLWAGEEGMLEVFDDITALGGDCRFRDCRHQGEPGCAVQGAIDSGVLEAGRMESYRKMQREIAYTERQKDERAKREEQQRWKQIHKAARVVQRMKGR